MAVPSALGRPAWPRVAAVLLAAAATCMAGAVLLLWSSPLAPLLLAGGALGAAAVLLLLQYPLVAFCLAMLLYLWPYGLQPHAFDLLYTIGANGAIALALGASILHAGTASRRFQAGRTIIALALFIAWAAVTAIWAPDLVEARKRLVAFTLGTVMILLVSNEARDFHAADAMMAILRTAGWAMIACGFYSLFAGHYEFGSRLKIFGTNENDFGLYLLTMLPGVIWPVLRHQGWRKTLSMGLSVTYLTCSLGLIALSGSRGTSMSLLLMLLAFSFSRPVRPWGVVGIAMLLVAIACAPFLLETVMNRLTTEDGGEFGGRDVLWRAGFWMLSDVPLTGAGIGNGPFKLHNYIASLTGEFNRRNDLPAHNPLLEVGLETGLLGMALYVAVLASALTQFLRSRKRWTGRSTEMDAYFPLMVGVTCGYVSGWVKGGGMEDHATFFCLIALLVFPSHLLAAPVLHDTTSTPAAGCGRDERPGRDEVFAGSARA